MSPAKRKLIRTIVAIEKVRRVCRFGPARGGLGEVGRLLQRINQDLLEILGAME